MTKLKKNLCFLGVFAMGAAVGCTAALMAVSGDGQTEQEKQDGTDVVFQPAAPQATELPIQENLTTANMSVIKSEESKSEDRLDNKEAITVATPGNTETFLEGCQMEIQGISVRIYPIEYELQAKDGTALPEKVSIEVSLPDGKQEQFEHDYGFTEENLPDTYRKNVVVTDVNFDQHLDFLLDLGYYGNKRYYDCFLWDAGSGSFVYLPEFREIANPQIDYDKQEVISREAPYWLWSKLDYAGKMQLTGSFSGEWQVSGAAVTPDSALSDAEIREFDGRKIVYLPENNQTELQAGSGKEENRILICDFNKEILSAKEFEERYNISLSEIGIDNHSVSYYHLETESGQDFGCELFYADNRGMQLCVYYKGVFFLLERAAAV